MAKFSLTSLAKADLLDIGIYTIETWGESQKDKYLAELDGRFQWLSDNPMLGRSRDDVKKSYRSFTEGSHVIFYRVTGGDIEIIGVPHQSMDVEQHLIDK